MMTILITWCVVGWIEWNTLTIAANVVLTILPVLFLISLCTSIKRLNVLSVLTAQCSHSAICFISSMNCERVLCTVFKRDVRCKWTKMPTYVRQTAFDFVGALYALSLYSVYSPWKMWITFSKALFLIFDCCWLRQLLCACECMIALSNSLYERCKTSNRSYIEIWQTCARHSTIKTVHKSYWPSIIKFSIDLFEGIYTSSSVLWLSSGNNNKWNKQTNMRLNDVTSHKGRQKTIYTFSLSTNLLVFMMNRHIELLQQIGPWTTDCNNAIEIDLICRCWWCCCYWRCCWCCCSFMVFPIVYAHFRCNYSHLWFLCSQK